MVLGEKLCDLPALFRNTILLETAIRLVWYCQFNQIIIKQGCNTANKVTEYARLS